MLEVRGLSTDIVTAAGTVRAVRDVDLSIRAGEVFGIVGESGSGKSVTALSIFGLLPRPAARTTAGSIAFEGEELREASDARMRQLRGDRMSMIFQEPMTSLNPVLRIGEQIGESLRVHRRMPRAQARRVAVDLLARVGIVEPVATAGSYPHRLSGGMRQRAMIAMAMACDPKLLIADEPTTALDVTIQAQVLDLIDELRRASGTAVLMITHNFGIIAEKADRVAVMYAGEVVEEADARRLLTAPLHPYTEGLIASVPRLGARRQGQVPRLAEIPGLLPDPTQPRQGCAFAPRCPLREPRCTAAVPPLREVQPGHRVRCVVRGVA